MGSYNRSYLLTIHNVQIQEIHASPLNARVKVRHMSFLEPKVVLGGSGVMLKIRLRQDVWDAEVNWNSQMT